MKRFCYKIIGFFLIIGAISSFINYVYIRRDHSDPQNIRKFRNIPSSIMVCNFGSSHGLYGFNYSDIKEIKCFNFALSSQVLSYDQRIFNYYKDNIADGAVVFIPVSYFSLYGNPEITNDDFQNKNKRYYQILPSQMIKEYEIKTDIYVKFPSLTAGVNLVHMLIFGLYDTNDNTWTRLASDIDPAFP